MRKEPAAFNFSGDFPLEANSLSAYKNNYLQQCQARVANYYPKIWVPSATCHSYIRW